jgi:hypothetical protein
MVCQWLVIYLLQGDDLESKLMVSAIFLARGDPESKLVP